MRWIYSVFLYAVKTKDIYLEAYSALATCYGQVQDSVVASALAFRCCLAAQAGKARRACAYFCALCMVKSRNGIHDVCLCLALSA